MNWLKWLVAVCGFIWVCVIAYTFSVWQPKLAWIVAIVMTWAWLEYMREFEKPGKS